MTLWIAPLGGPLELLVHWLGPILERPGLTGVPLDELHVELGESSAKAAPSFEPFSALVGPVRVDRDGVTADVIPIEPFLELRDALALHGDFVPRVVFAHAAPDIELEPLEAIASESVVVSAIVPA